MELSELELPRRGQNGLGTSKGLNGFPYGAVSHIPTPAEIILNTTHIFMPNNRPISPSVFLSHRALPDQEDASQRASTSNNGDRTMYVVPANENEDDLLVAKVEPTSSDSNPNTPRMLDRRIVPLCAICSTDSTGIHFGVDACAACSAFFRRTVVLNKHYGCQKGNNCNVVKDGTAGQKCRACRFIKCLRVGMDKNAVQHRRDAIGKYSAGVKREYSPDDDKQSVFSPPTPVPSQPRSPARPLKPMLEEFQEKHAILMSKRRIFYAQHSCEKMFDHGELEVVEMSDYEECMYQLWRIEPRLTAEYVMTNRFLSSLSSAEKVKLFKPFVILRQAVEEPYITWKNGGLEKNWWIMANRTYIDIDKADKYWEDGVISKKLNLQYTDAKNLFESSFKGAMKNIGEQMRSIDLTELEMVALCALCLIEPSAAGLEFNTRLHLWQLRQELLREIFNLYDQNDEIESPELRVDNLLTILGAIKVHAIQTAENMQLLHTFGLIARDKMFEDICVSGDHLVNNACMQMDEYVEMKRQTLQNDPTGSLSETMPRPSPCIATKETLSSALSAKEAQPGPSSLLNPAKVARTSVGPVVVSSACLKNTSQ